VLSLDELQKRVNELAARIAAPPESLPSFGRTMDFGRPHIECGDSYHWVVIERGREQERRTTKDPDELYYWIFEAVSFDMAMARAMAEQRPNEDFRRALFRQQIDLIATLDPAWGRRCRDEIGTILAKDPFADGGPPSLE
jgi:Immunity protein 63